MPFEYTWGGVLGMSLNNGTAFGPIGDGLWAAVGHNGVGVALGTTAGRLVADLVVSERSALHDDMAALPKPACLSRDAFLGDVLSAHTRGPQ